MLVVHGSRDFTELERIVLVRNENETLITISNFLRGLSDRNWRVEQYIYTETKNV